MHQHYKLFSKGKYYFPKKLLNHGGSNSTFMAIGNDLMRFLLLFHQLCTFLDKMSMSLYVMPSHIIKERSDIIQSKCEKQELNWKLTVYKFYLSLCQLHFSQKRKTSYSNGCELYTTDHWRIKNGEKRKPYGGTSLRNLFSLSNKKTFYIYVSCSFHWIFRSVLWHAYPWVVTIRESSTYIYM